MLSVFKVKRPVIKDSQPLHTALQCGVWKYEWNDETDKLGKSIAEYPISEIYEMYPGLKNYLMNLVREGKGNRRITNAIEDYIIHLPSDMYVGIYVVVIGLIGIDGDDGRIYKMIERYNVKRFLKYQRLVDEGKTYKFYKEKDYEQISSK